MKSIREARDLETVRCAWSRIFKTNDPFVWPFQPGFEVGRLFYPTDGYHLTEPQYQALASAIAQSGDDECLISTTESDGTSFLDRSSGHWVCGASAYEEYCSLALTLENALYSRAGRWGVLISHEQHALIAGTSRFLTALTARYSKWTENALAIREAWSCHPNADWLEEVLSHIRDE